MRTKATLEQKIRRGLGTLSLFGYMALNKTIAFAADPAKKSVNGSVDVEQGTGRLLGLALTICQGVGGVVALTGLIMLGLGYANDNTDNISRGVKMLVGGAVMAGGVTALKWFGLNVN